MSEQLVNGYLVVDSVPGRRYQGIDREPWATIDEGYYRGSLPHAIHYLYHSMQKESGLWWPTASSREQAEALLAFSRQHNPSATLIAVWSPYLKREVRRGGWSDTSVQLAGFDVISVGEWSLLRALEQAYKVPPPGLRQLIMDNWLLPSASKVRYIERLYRRLAEKGHVEAIADRGPGTVVEPVAVFAMVGSPHESVRHTRVRRASG